MIIDITSQERERSQSRATLQKLKDEYKKQDDLTHIDISKDD
jgi:FMN-dependent NADH-azoreductase